MFRLSTNSSNINIFTQNKYDYEMALKIVVYKAKLVYKSREETVDVHNRNNNRARKILWFTLPYNMAITNKIRKEFLRLLKKNFPLSSSLSKMLNRNTVK